MNNQQVRGAARREKIVSMRKVGLTYAEIGHRLGISGERVRQILSGKVDRQPKTSGTDCPLRISDVARLLNVHANTVRRWSNRGILKAYRIGPRGDRRFEEGDVNRLFRGRISA